MIKVDRIGDIIKFRMARTLFGRGIYFTAAYWVDGLLIDTGCSYTVGELTAALDGLYVDSIVNTHSHEDHVAGNADIYEKHRCKIMAHYEALPILTDPHKNKLRPYQILMWGRPKPSNAVAVGDIVETRTHQFKVIRTPGHSKDHICLHEPDSGLLFTGDAYVGGKDRALRADYNIRQIIESLKQLAALDSSLLFPGSGTERTNPKHALEEKIEYLEESGFKVMELHRKGWSRRQILKQVFGPELPIAYYTLGNFSGMNLVRSYIEDSPEP